MRIFAALLFICMVTGCSDSPTSYVTKLKISPAKILINKTGMLTFSVPIKHDGNKSLANIPVDLTCNITVTGSTPKSETFNTGPFAAGEKRTVKHQMDPFPIGIYTQPSCTYQVSRVEF